MGADGVIFFLAIVLLIVQSQVIELNPSSYRGYELKHAALHGAQCYDEAVEAFKIMISKMDHSPDPQIQRKPA